MTDVQGIVNVVTGLGIGIFSWLLKLYGNSH